MYNILIASLDNWDSCAEVPYIFKKAGCQVDVYCRKGDWLQTNRFHDHWIEAPLDNELFLEQFLTLANTEKYALIILTDEPLLKGLSEIINDECVFKKVMPLTKIENKKMLSSKIGFSDFCIANNIQTPKYSFYESDKDFEKIVTNLKFPLLNKNEYSWGGTDMSIINSKQELIELLKKIKSGQSILFQEFIDGEELRVDAYYQNGELMVYFCAKVLNYATNRFSYNTRRVYHNNPKLKPLLIELGKISGANGFANINYIYEPKTDNYYLIEMDLRTNSWLAYSQYLSKTNFITVIQNIILKRKQEKPDATLYKEGIEIGLFYKDLKRVYWQKDLKGLLRWVFNIKGYWRYLPFYDLKLSKLIIKNLTNEFIINRIKYFLKKK